MQMLNALHDAIEGLALAAAGRGHPEPRHRFGDAARKKLESKSA